MNDQKYAKKVEKDVEEVKKNLRDLVEEGVDHLGEKVEKISGDAKEAFVNATATVRKDVGHGLSQYNTKAQEYAEKIPGGVAEKASQYPWVAISIGLLIGLLVGGLLKPSRR